jgi:hypothetical protein
MTRTLAATLLIGLTSISLFAQTENHGDKVRFSVTRFDPRDRPIPEFILKNGSTETEISVPLTYIAGPFTATLREEKYLDFFKPGSEEPELSTAIPPEMRKNLLLVFVPREDTFEILKIHVPPAGIKGGDHYVINATPHEVAIKFGAANPIQIPSKKGALLHDPSAGNSLTLPVVIHQKEGEEWKPVTTENWPHDNRFRTFLFLFTSARDHHMAFHGITQRVE